VFELLVTLILALIALADSVGAGREWGVRC
jgi:hypothetical protein